MFRYRQTIPVVLLAERLGFQGVSQFLEFAAPFGLTYTGQEGNLLCCKTSMAVLTAF